MEVVESESDSGEEGEEEEEQEEQEEVKDTTKEVTTQDKQRYMYV